uniref:Mediator of RNA polymerase II transcription subunit 27 n=1 Tax=Macrostomum lignano TaxID=282301 RepID=A0A1I8H3H3_9PLAT
LYPNILLADADPERHAATTQALFGERWRADVCGLVRDGLATRALLHARARAPAAAAAAASAAASRSGGGRQSELATQSQQMRNFLERELSRSYRTQCERHHRDSDRQLSVSVEPASPCTNLAVVTTDCFHVLLFTRGLVIEMAQVLGLGEPLPRPNQAWPSSHFRCFRQLTAGLLQLLVAGRQSGGGTSLLQLLIKWLCAFRNLFMQRCARCDRILRDQLPPTWFDFRKDDRPVYHLACKSAVCAA